jgi:hypothetical protein
MLVFCMHRSLTRHIFDYLLRAKVFIVNSRSSVPKTSITLVQRKFNGKIKETIKKAGVLMKRNFISPNLESLLTRRNGQVVAVTDLPIEWINFEGVPFSFSHDICRLPETSLYGLMSHYVVNNQFTFSVPSDVISKTLVIFGNDDPHFRLWQVPVVELSKTHNFRIAKCNSVKEVKRAIETHRSAILVFDCHARFDKLTNSTYLEIGNEKLTATQIVENRITAPIVFISACGTAPTFGTFATVSNAFFEIGALAVTSTYLPISIFRGSILYLRLLGNLNEAATKPIHKNWLSFVSHLIRSSAIQEGFLKATFEGGSERMFVTPHHAEALAESMIFENRRDLFKKLDSRIRDLVKRDSNYFSNVIPEYLYYSNQGRQDLIEFQSWKDVFIAENLLPRQVQSPDKSAHQN